MLMRVTFLYSTTLFYFESVYDKNENMYTSQYASLKPHNAGISNSRNIHLVYIATGYLLSWVYFENTPVF